LEVHCVDLPRFPRAAPSSCRPKSHTAGPVRDWRFPGPFSRADTAHVARALASDVPARLLYSARTRDEIIYRRELEDFDTRITLTREQPGDWSGYTRRIDREMLEDVAWPAADRPLVYISGLTAFVETVAQLLVDLGHEPGRIRTERFGSTGQMT
jgi:ferredoxin-NADP reductase